VATQATQTLLVLLVVQVFKLQHLLPQQVQVLTAVIMLEAAVAQVTVLRAQVLMAVVVKVVLVLQQQF
jgi:hypothetical protein